MDAFEIVYRQSGRELQRVLACIKCRALPRPNVVSALRVYHGIDMSIESSDRECSCGGRSAPLQVDRLLQTGA